METEKKELQYIPTEEERKMRRVYAIRVMDYLTYQTPKVGKFFRSYPDMDAQMFHETMRDLQGAVLTGDFSKFQ